MFIVYKKATTGFRPPSESDFFVTGDKILSAGYLLFGPSTMIVYHAGFRVNGYTYDPDFGEFVLSHPRIKCPKRKGIISIDMS